MKTACLFILMLIALYNGKVLAREVVRDLQHDMHSLAELETALAQVQLQKRAPLENVDANLENYAQLVEIHNEFKHYSIGVSKDLLTKIQNRDTLSGNELYLIKKMFDFYYEITFKVMEFGDVYHYRLTSMSRNFSKLEEKLPMVKAHLIWLSSNVMVLDHMLELHSILFAEDGSLRRIVKTSISDKSFGSEGKKKLKDITDLLEKVLDRVHSSKFQQQITLVHTIKNNLVEAPQLIQDSHISTVLEEILTNKTSLSISKGKTRFHISFYGVVDTLLGFVNKVTNALSGFFGNLAGSISWRKGYFFNNHEAITRAQKTLKSMDIILDKSPFILTDKFIPGHYGHVALYLGTKEQLLENGLWNHPSILPLQSQIEDGKVILEAIRTGVRLASIEQFMNIDEFTIMRKDLSNMTADQLNDHVARGIDQLGKDYDFNFDISTLDKIVCSELIYIVFGNINWPTNYRFGRPTITPDDVAEVLFQKHTKFELVDYYLSTKRNVIQDADIHTLAPLLNYELRTSNGDPIHDKNDETNSFWKKETKCYTVNSSNTHFNSETKTRECKTVYKEYYYDEVG